MSEEKDFYTTPVVRDTPPYSDEELEFSRETIRNNLEIFQSILEVFHGYNSKLSLCEEYTWEDSKINDQLIRMLNDWLTFDENPLSTVIAYVNIHYNFNKGASGVNARNLFRSYRQVKGLFGVGLLDLDNMREYHYEIRDWNTRAIVDEGYNLRRMASAFAKTEIGKLAIEFEKFMFPIIQKINSSLPPKKESLEAPLQESEPDTTKGSPAVYKLN